jgi:hypothetical protein
MKRKAISDAASQATTHGSENTTNSQRSSLKMRRRPTLSASGPSRPAPTIAPRIAAAEMSPFVADETPKSSAISGLATPMMKKSKPSSMMPRPASSQKRRCSFDIGASSSALPRGSGSARELIPTPFSPSGPRAWTPLTGSQRQLAAAILGPRTRA